MEEGQFMTVQEVAQYHRTKPLAVYRNLGRAQERNRSIKDEYGRPLVTRLQ